MRTIASAASAAVALLLVSHASLCSAQAAVRGIPKSMEPSYSGSGGKFVCLDKSKTIDFAQVNDDYCDCADGSDEPGTNACSNARFYCTNKGYRGKFIPSMFVNDGVCDCCDGSDEFASRVKCANTCDVDGAAWRQQQAAAIAAAEAGGRARMEYSKIGQDAAVERASKIAEAQKRLDSAVSAKTAAEAAVSSAESTEKEETAARRLALTTNGALELSKSMGLAGLSKDAAIAMLAEWVHSTSQAAALETWLGDQAKAGKLPGITPDGSWSAKVLDISKPEEAVPDVRTAEGDKARADLATAKADESRAQSDLSSLKEEESTDYGADSAFYKLKGACLDYQEAQYRYSVCPFGRATQDGTHLGTFSGWAASADGSNKWEKMLFTGGTMCWNGPARSLTVTVICGSVDKVHSVTEPEKCTYAGIMESPAACDDRAAKELRLTLEGVEEEVAGPKDEL